MSGWEGWLIGISVAIVAIAFVVLVVFLVLVLRELRHSLKQTDRLIQETAVIMQDVESKMHAIDPLFKIVSSVGNAFSNHKEEEERKETVHKRASCALDLTEWALMGVQILQKFKERR